MAKLIAATAGTALMLVVVTSAWAATPKLVGTVGPGYTITLTKAGKKVTKLKAGKYTFVIADKALDPQLQPRRPEGLREDLHERAIQGHEDASR